MTFEENKGLVLERLARLMKDIDMLDENENEVFSDYEGEVISVNGYEAIYNKIDEMYDDIDSMIYRDMRDAIFQQEDLQDELEDYQEEFEEDDDVEFNGIHYMDDEDEFDNYLRELDLLNQTIKVFDYDPYRNGIVIDNVNIEPGFGGIQVMGELTKIDENENEDGFVTINVVLYEADEFDDSIRVLRKEVYDIDLDTIDDYSVFDVEVDLDPDTLDRTSGVNIYLSR